MAGYTKRHIETDRMVGFMKDKRGFIIYDTETTGLKKNYDRVVEFSADLYEQVNSKYAKTDSLEIYIHQPISPSPETIEVNHITPEFLQDKPEEAEAWKVIKDFLNRHSDAVLSGYNILTFDDTFMDNMALRYGEEFWTGDRVDIYTCAKENTEGKYKNLSAVFERFYPKESFDAHNSTGDIEATWKIAVAIAKENWAVKIDPQVPVTVTSYFYNDFGGRQGKYLFVKINKNGVHMSVQYSFYEKGWKGSGDDKDKEVTLSDQIQIEQQLNASAKARGVDDFTKLKFAGKC